MHSKKQKIMHNPEKNNYLEQVPEDLQKLILNQETAFSMLEGMEVTPQTELNPRALPAHEWLEERHHQHEMNKMHYNVSRHR